MRGVMAAAGMGAALAAGGLTMALAAEEPAAAKPEPESVVTKPSWAKLPSADVMGRYFPEEAMDRSIRGKVTVMCKVAVEGNLTDCEVLSETPLGMGFGKAVKRVAEREFRMTPQTKDGVKVDGATIRIPVVLTSHGYLSGSGTVIMNPVWAKAPTFEDMAAAWPASADELPSGEAALRCKLTRTGALDQCIIAGAVPRGGPFGEAARGLAGKFQVRLTPEEAEEYARSDVMVSFRFLNPATPEGKARKVVQPEWTTRIDPKKIVALFPAAAADKGVTSGVGVADCLVSPDGRLTDCKVARETPEGLGFGNAAVLVAGVTQMNPWTPGGRPAQGVRVKLPINFNLADEPAEVEGGQ